MSGLQQGDAVYLVTLNQGVQEIRYWSDAGDGSAWLVHPEDWENSDEIEEECLYFQCSQHSWRPTRPEALQLLKQKLEQRRQQLAREIQQVTDRIGEIINELDLERA